MGTAPVDSASRLWRSRYHADGLQAVITFPKSLITMPESLITIPKSLITMLRNG
jgi:hypothetical protein